METFFRLLDEECLLNGLPEQGQKVHCILAVQVVTNLLGEVKDLDQIRHGRQLLFNELPDNFQDTVEASPFSELVNNVREEHIF